MARIQRDPDRMQNEDAENLRVVENGPADSKAKVVEALREEPAELKTTPSAPLKPKVATSSKLAKNRKKLRRILLITGPLAVVAAAVLFYIFSGRYVSTDNAYVKMDKLNISTDVSGIVAAIPVKDNQRVGENQILFQLDDEPYRIALNSAQAQLESVRNEIATLQANYRLNLAQIEQAKSDVVYFEANFNRQSDLANRKVASQAALDQAKRDFDAAKQRLDGAKQQAQATLAQLGGSADGKIEDHARYKQALANVDKAKRDLDHTIVRAPTNGVVTNVPSLQVGQYLQAAQPAFSLVATGQIWVEASPKETDLTFLKPGDPATITIDAYPRRTWKGSVASISPASGAEFSVLPAQNTSGNWVKVVQRLTVRVAVDMPADSPPLRAGMSAVVDMDTGHRRSFGEFFATVGHWVGF